MPGVSARGKENIRVPTCPGSWPAGRIILNMPEVAARKRILNMPGVLTRGKKKVKVSICPGF